MAYDFYVRSQQDLVNAVNEYGIIPYFSASIPGFSLEEHCPAWILFSDDEENTWYWTLVAGGRNRGIASRRTAGSG